MLLVLSVSPSERKPITGLQVFKRGHNYSQKLENTLMALMETSRDLTLFITSNIHKSNLNTNEAVKGPHNLVSNPPYNICANISTHGKLKIYIFRTSWKSFVKREEAVLDRYKIQLKDRMTNKVSKSKSFNIVSQGNQKNYAEVDFDIEEFSKLSDLKEGSLENLRQRYEINVIDEWTYVI